MDILVVNSINRTKIGTLNEMTLYSEVGGICPLCSKSLLYEKTKAEKCYEIAHIYPLNATPQEKLLLQGEERLHSDLNHVHNLILLCPNCHTKFDKPRTLDGYRKMVAIKKRLIERGKIFNEFGSYKIEEEIIHVLEMLSKTDEISESNQLKYSALKISDKTNDSITILTKREIEGYVVDFYNTIKQKFIEMEKDNPGSFELIANQVRSFYLQTKKNVDNQDTIYQSMVEWLNVKTNNYSHGACRIIVSFFVQNCEVFS